MNTEPLILANASAIEVWKAGAELLVKNGDRFNLTLHITHPISLNEADVAQYCHKRVVPRLSKSVYDVANTIFPSTSSLHSGDLKSFFLHYDKVYRRGQRRHRTAWGTYFLRLTAFGDGQANQLEKIIFSMQNWKSRPRAAFVLHLSSAEVDNPKTLGAPCWQYAQFIRNEDNTLSMVAVYRSHDYFQKALGNLVGLIRLLRFVCHHSRMTPGTLTCLSTYATLQGQKENTRRLLRLS